jgi:hypothetical protein
MWYKGRYITISRTKEEHRWYSDKSTLEITSVSLFNHNSIIFLKPFLKNLFS